MAREYVLRDMAGATASEAGPDLRALNQIMPTRLGNVLRSAESLAGSQYGMNALQAVPLLILIADVRHVDYVNDQRTQLDLAVRMTFISVAAFAVTILFLWPYGLWLLVAVIPYALAYLSYRGAVELVKRSAAGDRERAVRGFSGAGL